jgi:hypothetical protein
MSTTTANSRARSIWTLSAQASPSFPKRYDPDCFALPRLQPKSDNLTLSPARIAKRHAERKPRPLLAIRRCDAQRSTARFRAVFFAGRRRRWPSHVGQPDREWWWEPLGRPATDLGVSAGDCAWEQAAHSRRRCAPSASTVCSQRLKQNAIPPFFFQQHPLSVTPPFSSFLFLFGGP